MKAILEDGPMIPEFRRINWDEAPPVAQENYSGQRCLYSTLSRWQVYLEIGGRAYRFVAQPGCVCDLTSVPGWVPRWLAAKTSRTNWQDAGALIHDMLHMGIVSPPGINRRLDAAKFSDTAMLAVNLMACPTEGQRMAWRKYRGVRLTAWMLYWPNAKNRGLMPAQLMEVIPR